MLEEEIDIKDIQSTFDIKGFFFRILRYWYVIVISILVACGITYYINLRAEKLYKLDTLITIKEEQNPFFTSTLNLTFNWGGASDKVETIRSILGSRSHNEEVVRLLQTYIHYMEDGRFRLEEIHKKAPFVIDINEKEQQLIDIPLKIVFKDKDTYTLSYAHDKDNVQLINYTKNELQEVALPNKFKEEYALNTPIVNDFINFTMRQREDKLIQPGAVYYVKFTKINEEINKYRQISITVRTKGTSMLGLSLVGNNRSILADYLNATVDILSIKQLEFKNLFATNTIEFIDKQIQGVSDSLKQDENRLKNFRQENEIFDLSTKGESIFEQMAELDVEKNTEEIKLAYLNQLESYLNNSTNYSDLPAPASSGLDDPTLVTNVAEIINLSVQRSNLESKIINPSLYQEIDGKIDALKSVLLRSVTSGRTKNNIALENVNQRIERLRYEFKKLPSEEQQLFNIERRYRVSEASYSSLLEKRNEAGVVKAANVSDINVIDPAQDLNQGAIYPKTQQNYLLGAFAGLLFPLLIFLVLSFLDHNVHGPSEIEQLSTIPLLGVVGRSKGKNNLAVYDQPRSAISEAFRAVRSSLQFIYRSQSIEGSKTVMITSSVSGEGKTFCSINIASVFALSSKKTVLVGLDLRKPKIFDDFEIKNEIGVVNYLIDQNSLDEIVQKTQFENLDIITSGPIPPNPAELLISDKMKLFIDELKKKYDYIVLDTPPLGLVADAIELADYADASLYIVRQSKTKKGMLNFINNKYKKKEIKNLSFILNDYRHKSQYGYGDSYSYGYGYGYGGYGNGYHDTVNKPTLIGKIKNIFRKNT